MSKMKKKQTIDVEVRGCFNYDTEESCELNKCLWVEKNCKSLITNAPTRRPTILKKNRKLIIDEQVRGCFNYDTAETCEENNCEWTGKDCLQIPTLAPTNKPTTVTISVTLSPTNIVKSSNSPSLPQSPIIKQCTNIKQIQECNNLLLPYKGK